MAERTTTIRLNDEDQKVLGQLRKRTGIVATTQLIRLSLRLALGADRTGSVLRANGAVARRKT